MKLEINFSIQLSFFRLFDPLKLLIPRIFIVSEALMKRAGQSI